MKKHTLSLFCLATVLSQASFAGDECCQPCEPCCVPQPKKCIDCECYTPAFYDLQCDWGASIDVEFLYWYARETNLAYALKVEGVRRDPASTSPVIFAPQNYKHVGTKWDPGFRLGIGWNSSCDGWDTNLTWTYFRNKERSSTSVPDFTGVTGFEGLLPLEGEFALLNPWVNGSFVKTTTSNNQNNTPLLFDKVSAKWNLTFNSVDLELGRKYWLSECFNLRPYAGLRGAWTKTSYRTRSTRNFEDANITIDLSVKDRFTNRNWGVGFLGGIQPTWYYCSNFALYANVDAALVWGEFKVKKRETYKDEVTGSRNTLFIDHKNRWNSNFFQMTAILDTALGLRWEESWCCDRYRTTFDLGWEHHIWFDQNHRIKNVDYFEQSGGTGFTDPRVAGFRKYIEESGNLGYGGLVIRIRWDF